MIQTYKNKLQQLKGQKDLLVKQMKESEQLRNSYSVALDVALQARTVAQIVAEQTQKKIEWQISNIVSAALASVFPDPYTFNLRFVQRRNKTEADLIFSKRGKETDDILNSGGGGAANIASFALRIALWSISKGTPVMVLDEPTHFLHDPEYQEKASEMFKNISEELKMQLIIISDQKALLKAADRVIMLNNVNGVSSVETL
jgi:DNA repair exonuclease SbcCD ATPase subunit